MPDDTFGWSGRSGALSNDAGPKYLLLRERARRHWNQGRVSKGLPTLMIKADCERAMFSSEADVGVQVESYLDAMGGEQSLEAARVSDAARCQLWTSRAPILA